MQTLVWWSIISTRLAILVSLTQQLCFCTWTAFSCWNQLSPEFLPRLTGDWAISLLMLPRGQRSGQCSGQDAYHTLTESDPLTRCASDALFLYMAVFFSTASLCKREEHTGAVLCLLLRGLGLLLRRPSCDWGETLLGGEYKSADSCINHACSLQPLQKPGLVPTKRVCDCA